MLKRKTEVEVHVRVMHFILAIRKASMGISYAGIYGNCYAFACLIRQFVGASNHQFYYCYRQGHVYSKVGNRLYDVQGARLITDEQLMTKFDFQKLRPWRWSHRKMKKLWGGL